MKWKISIPLAILGVLIYLTFFANMQLEPWTLTWEQSDRADYYEVVQTTGSILVEGNIEDLKLVRVYQTEISCDELPTCNPKTFLHLRAVLESGNKQFSSPWVSINVEESRKEKL